MNRITPFECKYGKDYPLRNTFGGDYLGSARNKLASLIDSQWFYSMHWPDDHNQFLDKAQYDLNTELVHAKKRLAELESAQKILSSIDREEHDTGESS